MKLKARSLADC